MSKDYTRILEEAYNKFLLQLGGKKVPTPYRRNEAGSFQKLRPEFQGKSSPQTLTETTLKLAKQHQFDLKKANIEQIRDFMSKNKLGIDCSGFAYRVMNYLTEKLKLGNLQKACGFEHVGRTNARKLTDLEFNVKVEPKDIREGDLIRVNSNGDIGHCMIVIKRGEGSFIYAHSGGVTKVSGVHQAEADIVDNQIIFKEDLGDMTYLPSQGDGVRRLKALVRFG